VRRLLFVPNPHVRLDRAWAAPYVPLELLSAMATAEGAGAEPALFDVNRLVEHGRLRVGPELWEEAAELAAEAAPALMVLEAWTGTLHNTLLLARAMRRRHPAVPLVLAGAGTSALAVEVIQRFPEVDAVIRGELEPAVEALSAADPDAALPPAPGLVRRVPGGVADAPHAWVEDLEGIPRAAYHLALLQPGDAIPVEPGRGCQRGCTFCALAGHWPPVYRPRDPASLAREMRSLGQRYPGSLLDLTQDPTFFTDRARVAELCETLGSDGPRWTCHARPDRLDPETLQAMARAGCAGLLLGVESGCPDMQARLRKDIDLARLEPCLREASRLGMEARCTFMVGLPHEDVGAVGRTARVMMSALSAGASGVGVELLRAYPGSEVHQDLAGDLAFEPLLCTAAPTDGPAMRLVQEHPDLLSASYRVPGSLPREELLAVWVALACLAEPMAALRGHGVDPGELLVGLRLDPVPTDLVQAARQVASLLEARGLALAPAAAPAAWRDMLAYHVALLELGRAADPEATGQADRAAALGVHGPDRGCPVMTVPHRLLELATDLEQLVEGRLDAGSLPAPAPVLVARAPTPGEASYYTQRSSALESFQLDPVGAELVRRCDGSTPLTTLANAMAPQLNLSPRRALEECTQALEELAEAGLMAVIDPGACRG